MANYNTQLQSNNTDLQTILQTLQDKAAGGGQPDLINFTVQYGYDTSPTTLNCQAENGMSLGSWIFSDYNNIPIPYDPTKTPTYQISYNGAIQFHLAMASPILEINGTKVDAFDIIQPNGVYTAVAIVGPVP